MPEAFVYDHLRTPRGKGKAAGSLHEVKPIDLVVGLIGELRTRNPNLDTNRIDDVVLGGVSGFFGGMIDTVIQRIIEILRSIPTIPLWMGLAAALPAEWSVVQVYFAITIIISLIGWTELARVVRGRFISLKEEDFVMAAELVGCSKSRIIFRHMVPSFISHIIAATTLAIPAIIISETSLSFLGLGMPITQPSLGMLIANGFEPVLHGRYWISLFPGMVLVTVVLALNLVGARLRAMADPRATISVTPNGVSNDSPSGASMFKRRKCRSISIPVLERAL